MEREKSEVGDFRESEALLFGNLPKDEELDIITKGRLLEDVVSREILSGSDVTHDDRLPKHVMPVIKGIFKELFQCNASIMSGKVGENGQREECFRHLQAQIEVCVRLFDLLNEIMKSYEQVAPVGFTKISTVIFNTASILHGAFEHFKNSEKLYRKRSEMTVNILELFSRAQKFHLHFLKLLISHVTLDGANRTEVALFIDVLDVLCEVGEVVFAVNAKSTLEHWKGFVILVRKHTAVVQKHGFDGANFLKTIVPQIILKLEAAFEAEDVSDDMMMTAIKCACNLITPLEKIVEIFGCGATKKNCELLINFFITVHSYNVSRLKCKRYSREIVCLVQNLFSDEIATLTLICMKTGVFLEMISTFNGEMTSLLNVCPAALLFFYNDVLQKLSSTGYTLVKSEDFDFVSVLDVLFFTLGEGFSELLGNLRVEDGSENGVPLYQELTVSVAAFSLFFSHRYREVEFVLIKNVLSGNALRALFAVDVWDLILRNCPPQLRRQIICNLIESGEIFLAPNYRDAGLEGCFMKNLLTRLFALLSKSDALEVIKKYGRAAWKIARWGTFDSHQYLLNTSLKNVCGKIHLLTNKRITIDDFNSLCDDLEVISKFNFSNSSLPKNQLDSLAKLWDFCSTGDAPVCNNFFNTYTECLLRATDSFLMNCNDEQTAMILDSVRRLAKNENQNKIACLGFLRALSKRNTLLEQQSAIVADIFAILLKDKNAVVAQVTDDVLDHFRKHGVVGVDEADTFSCGEKFRSDLPVLEKYQRALQRTHFEHRCLSWNGEGKSAAKKAKISDDEAEAILKCLRSDADYLKKRRHNLSREHFKAIAGVIKILQNLN